jgi:hypothetical protein
MTLFAAASIAASIAVQTHADSMIMIPLPLSTNRQLCCNFMNRSACRCSAAEVGQEAVQQRSRLGTQVPLPALIWRLRRELGLELRQLEAGC